MPIAVRDIPCADAHSRPCTLFSASRPHWKVERRSPGEQHCPKCDLCLSQRPNVLSCQLKLRAIPLAARNTSFRIVYGGGVHLAPYSSRPPSVIDARETAADVACRTIRLDSLCCMQAACLKDSSAGQLELMGAKRQFGGSRLHLHFKMHSQEQLLGGAYSPQLPREGPAAAMT